MELQAQALGDRGSVSNDAAAFAHFTSVIGYLRDDKNKDVVVFGFADTNVKNKLSTEDFCVALRNAWDKYALLRGNTYEYEYPGCSIDPDPATMRRLNEVEQSVNSNDDPEKVQRDLQQWRNICEEWQKVRVLGTPFNCQFSATQVQADYDMKVLVDGTDTLDIPGFDSLVGMKMQIVQQCVAAKRPISVSLAGMNRFWFFPGTNRYVEDDGIVWLKQCPVILLTEAMALSRRNGYGGTGQTEPLAQKFTEDFSKLYSKVAEQRGIYTDLENLLRFFVLAKVIQFREATDLNGLPVYPTLKNGLNLSGFLDRYPVATVSVADRLRGRSAIKEFKHEERTADSTSTYQLWLQSCGGVEMRVEPKPEDFTKGSPVLRHLKAAILAARPPGRPLFWDLGPNDPAVMETKNALELADINMKMDGLETSGPNGMTKTDPQDGFVLPSEPNRRRRFAVKVAHTASSYQVFTENGAISAGDRVSMVEDVLKRSHSFDADRLAVETTGLAGSDLQAFRAATDAEAKRVSPQLALAFVNADNSEAQLFETMLSPGVAVDAAQAADVDSLSSRQEVSIPLQTRLGGMNKEFYLDILTDDSEAKKAMLKSIESRMHGWHSADSVLRIWDDASSEIRKQGRFQNKRIQMRIRNVNGSLEIGEVNPAMVAFPA
jgi:hypothetical protein